MAKRSGSKSIAVYVADGEPIFGDALAGALKRIEGLRVVGDQPISGLKAVEEVASLHPDVALLDYWLKDMEGPASAVSIRARSPSTKVLLLAWFYGPREVTFALAAGAAGFLPKNLSLEAVAGAIRSAASGKSPVIPKSLEPVVANPGAADLQAAEVWEQIRSLTPREVEVLTMLGREMQVHRISNVLKISEATVRRHIHHILKKTHTASQFEAIAFARHYGILTR